MQHSEIQSVKHRFGIIGSSELLNRAIDIAVQVAPTDLSVLITGESGVGKENFPQIIHYYSHRHIRGNLILIAGVLAILKYRNHGVPAKVAIIRNKVLVNDLFNFQVKRLPFLLSGMNPFTHLDKGV
jgi:hypothetical protein